MIDFTIHHYYEGFIRLFVKESILENTLPVKSTCCKVVWAKMEGFSRSERELKARKWKQRLRNGTLSLLLLAQVMRRYKSKRQVQAKSKA